MIVLCISHMQLLREALLGIVGGIPQVKAIEAFSDETVQAIIAGFPPDLGPDLAPSLVIVEASHPDGKALVAAICAHIPTMAVVVLSMRELDNEFLAWADIGVAAYLGPNTSATSLMSTVHRVAAGDIACPPRLIAPPANGAAGHCSEPANRAGIDALTSREREIVALLAEGMSNKLIARHLSVALPTVQNHVHSILDKWDVRSRGEAAARFRQKTLQDGAPDGGPSAAIRASHISQMGGPTRRNSAMRADRSSPLARNAA